jgi:undecaprenyl-diphosphatase
MNLLHAALLGLIQGITQFLPVSANAHVILLGHWLGGDPALLKSLGVALQAAPALAVLILFRRRYDALLRPAHAGPTTFKGRRAWILFSLAVLPVLIAGFLFKRYFYGLMMDPLPSVIGLGLGGVGILIAEARHREAGASSLEDVSARQALIVGLFQCLALWPGVSRSGATIIGGLLLGLDRRTAAEFSFLAGVPVFLAAAALEFAHHESRHLLLANLPVLATAFVVAFGVALLSMDAFMKLLGRISFKPFGWYRIALSPLLYLYWSV